MVSDAVVAEAAVAAVRLLHVQDHAALEAARRGQFNKFTMVSDMFARWLEKKMVRAKFVQNAGITRWRAVWGTVQVYSGMCTKHSSL